MEIPSAITSHINSVYRSNLYSTPLRGMQAAQTQAMQASTQLARGEITPRNIVNLNASVYSFEANALVLRTLDQMQGTLLNTLA